VFNNALQQIRILEANWRCLILRLGSAVTYMYSTDGKKLGLYSLVFERKPSHGDVPKSISTAALYFRKFLPRGAFLVGISTFVKFAKGAANRPINGRAKKCSQIWLNATMDVTRNR
jgi:hypothetical protein